MESADWAHRLSKERGREKERRREMRGGKKTRVLKGRGTCREQFLKSRVRDAITLLQLCKEILPSISAAWCFLHTVERFYVVVLRCRGYVPFQFFHHDTSLN